MFESPLSQTIMGTFFTWGMTALGALGCLLHYSSIESRKLLDISLGFSAGVMLAASYWSLLSPAEEMALQTGYGSFSFIPLAVGLAMGALFVYGADRYAPVGSLCSVAIPSTRDVTEKTNATTVVITSSPRNGSELRHRGSPLQIENAGQLHSSGRDRPSERACDTAIVSRRLVLMMVAITIHNIPEGLAVGVAFGAAGKTKSATLASARNLALGIGIQNFPEGLAVSLPLKAAGMSLGRSIWYGQLSGLVEPLAGIIGCLAVQIISPMLPYALSFAAGAMIFVVFDDIIPESQHMGNGQLASLSAILGFVVMMCLDIGLA